MSRPRDVEGGFSLIELMVVLAIMSLAGIVLVQSAGLQGRKITSQSMADTIATRAREGSMIAISKSRTETLVIDIKNHSISLDGNKLVIQVPDTFSLKVTSGAELKYEDSKAVMEFYSDGSASGGQIEIRDDHGNSSVVNINWLTGVITTGARK